MDFIKKITHKRTLSIVLFVLFLSVLLSLFLYNGKCFQQFSFGDAASDFGSCNFLEFYANNLFWLGFIVVAIFIGLWPVSLFFVLIIILVIGWRIYKKRKNDSKESTANFPNQTKQIYQRNSSVFLRIVFWLSIFSFIVIHGIYLLLILGAQIIQGEGARMGMYIVDVSILIALFGEATSLFIFIRNRKLETLKKLLPIIIVNSLLLGEFIFLLLFVGLKT